jgi:hypothetical protein
LIKRYSMLSVIEAHLGYVYSIGTFKMTNLLQIL